MGGAIELALLGDAQISADGAPLDGRLPRKAVALVAFLAVTATPQPRERLAALLWGDAPAAAANASLRQALARLRPHLGDALLTDERQVALRPGRLAWCDVAILEAALRDAPDEERLRAATALYRGDFLAGTPPTNAEAFEEWAGALRARLRALALEGFRRLAALEAARGGHEAAAATLRALLRLEPWEEAAHRDLMAALARAGQPGAALAQYAALRRQLADDLGVAPAAETTRLRDDIRAAAAAAPDADPPDHNLPAPLAPLVGREEEARRAGALLDGAARLVTIVGAGGSGKTRLALAVAWAAREGAPGGVRWVELAGVRAAADPALARATLAGAVAAALGLTLPGRGDPLDALAAALRAHAPLLILDNCEHLPAVAGIARALLEATPALRLLATSREPLGLSGEAILRLDGLPVPGADAADPVAWPAGRLFLARAGQHAPAWVPDAAARRGVARLVRLLDGLPLAIELAAGWVGHFTPDEIADEIARDPDFLAARGRAVADRHRSLRAAFDYSWRLLGADEQAALRRLAIFRGGVDRAAARAVAGVPVAALAALVDKSLLRAIGAGRYDLHELVRQFAAERLAAAGEEETLADAHAAHYLALAEEAAPHLTGPEQGTWLARIEREADNLGAALGRARERGEATLMLRLAGALARYWAIRGHTAEGQDWLEAALALPGAAAAPAAIRARALYGAGILASDRGDHERAEERLSAGVALFEEIGDLAGAVRTLNTLGGVAFNRGDLPGALARFAACLALARDAGDAGEIARALGNLGETRLHLGDLAGAAAALDEALAGARAVGRRDVEAFVLADLGSLALRRGDAALAEERQRQALAIHRALGTSRQIAITLENLAALAATAGRAARSAQLLGAATALRAAIGVPRPVPERQVADAARATGEAALGADAWAARFAAGGALPLDAALDAALA